MEKLTSQISILDNLGKAQLVSGVQALRNCLKACILSVGLLAMGLTSLAATAGEPVNINVASAEVLAEALHGVGEKKAIRIIEYREAHGPFEDIEELAAVRGIGLDTVEKNRDVIRLQ
jgi:competence protein ComEA